jgi:hypothetical protein
MSNHIDARRAVRNTGKLLGMPRMPRVPGEQQQLERLIEAYRLVIHAPRRDAALLELLAAAIDAEAERTGVADRTRLMLILTAAERAQIATPRKLRKESHS